MCEAALRPARRLPAAARVVRRVSREQAAWRSRALGRELAEVVDRATRATEGVAALGASARIRRLDSRRPRDLGYWENWNVPELGRYDGMMWYRARVTLDTAQAKQAAKLSLGLIDDVDVAWVNGRAVGNALR